MTMPSARPQPPSGTTNPPSTEQHLATFRPGALMRLPHGRTFRVSKDGSRVHYDTAENRRNVVHLSTDVPGTAPAPPEGLVRALLAQFTTPPTWARAARNFRVHQSQDGLWRVALELRGTPEGRVRFPAQPASADSGPTGIVIDATDAESLLAVLDVLWGLADAYERDAPHVLLQQEQPTDWSAVG